MFDENTGTEVILPEEPNVRYILRKNPVRCEKERLARTSLINVTVEKLNAVAVPKKKTDDKTLAARAAKIFGKYKTQKYFEWDIVDSKVVYSLKDDVVINEEQYDGLYVIRSNVSTETMNTVQVVEAYKSLINVENAFRNMKTVNLELRPIYHKTDERIKAHVFVCMLSYYLFWHMNKALKPLYSENPDYTRDLVIEIMKSLQKFKLTVGNIISTAIAEPTEIQRNIQKMVRESVL